MRNALQRIEPFLTPLLAFGGIYLTALIVFSLVARIAVDRVNLGLGHLLSLAAVIVATLVCVLVLERGSWRLGLLVSPRAVFRSAGRGLVTAGVVVGFGHLLILALSEYQHVPGGGFDWALVLLLLVPAAFGEELLFRGYALQKLSDVSPGWAVLVTSLLFTIAHAGNPAVGAIPLANIFLAGVMLALLRWWDGTLWSPIFAHVGWNVLSGPILGHELSGLELGRTVLDERDPGPSWLTGGAFGIEGSVLVTVTVGAAIAFLCWRIRAGGRVLRQDATATTRAEVPDSRAGTYDDQDER